MAESSLFNMSPIVISALALIVSILSYLNSNKSLKISEKEHIINKEEHELTKEKEDRKENLTSFLKILTGTSKTLKELPDNLFIPDLDLLRSEIMQEVYENKKFDLIIKLKYLDVNGRTISLETIHDEKFLKKEIRELSDLYYKKNTIRSSIIYYETSPKLPFSDGFELMEIFLALGNLEQNINDLKKFELFLNSFDSGLLGTINNEYNEILKLIYNMLSEKTFHFEFNSDMKPSDIEKALLDSFNLTEIKSKSEVMATVLKGRVEEISKELSIRVLTN